jgi:probable F420-dependent oxidoreductase
MKFGVYAINGSPLTNPTLLDALAKAAEDYDYDTLWVADHVIMPEQLAQEHPYTGSTQFTAESMANTYEPIPTLAYLAGITKKPRLLTSVLVLPYRQPVVTAKMLSTIDQLSRGRLILGAGVGWLEDEFKALDANYPDRGPVTDEMIRVFKALWTEDLPEFHGKYYDFPKLRFLPKPVQQPHPPIWIGGHSRPALRRAAQLGDGWHATRQTVETIEGLLGQLRQQCERFDRDPADLTLSLKCNLRLGQPNTLPADLAGTPDQVAERVLAYRRLGIELIILDVRPHDSVEQQVETLARFAEDVKPLIDRA